jgi:hypothetical protein
MKKVILIGTSLLSTQTSMEAVISEEIKVVQNRLIENTDFKSGREIEENKREKDETIYI